MKLTYTGHLDEVVIVPRDGLQLVCSHGKTVEIPDDSAIPADYVAGLLVQTDAWKPADAAAKKIAATLAGSSADPEEAEAE